MAKFLEFLTQNQRATITLHPRNTTNKEDLLNLPVGAMA